MKINEQNERLRYITERSFYSQINPEYDRKTIRCQSGIGSSKTCRHNRAEFYICVYRDQTNIQRQGRAMPHKAKYITIIQGHPDPQPNHFGHALAEAYARGANEAGHETHLINVAMLDFPLLRSKQELEHGEPPAVIRQAQAELLRADHIVMIYPVWNGGLPALLRGFLEQTFRPAFIFPDAKPNEKLGFLSYFNQRKALKGKTAHIIATMQMPAFVYRWYFHPHTEKNTLSLGGIAPIRESLIGFVETPNGRKREEWLRKMYAFGREGR